VRSHAALRAAAALLVGALACAHAPAGRRFDAIPPIAPGLGRVVIYRTTSTDAPGFYPRVQVDDEVVGKLGMGSFVFADRSPDWHQIEVVRGRFESAFGEQSPGRPFALMLGPDETSYVELQVLVLGSSIQTNLLKRDAATAARALAPLHEAPPDAAD
jgi:hypothetical protein